MNEPTLKLRSKDGAAAGAIPVEQATLTSDELRKMDAYWRAANYLSVGQIYLYDNPCCTSR
jgi:phosphoketolase